MREFPRARDILPPPWAWLRIIRERHRRGAPPSSRRFLEMPDLRLTPRQIQRLCGVDAAICSTLLESLVNEGFLSVRPDGCYARVASGEIAHTRGVKADLSSEPRLAYA